jgi:hypothetical protein
MGRTRARYSRGLGRGLVVNGWWLVVANLAVRTVVLPADSKTPVLVRCPIHETTRIVLPEPLWQLKGSAQDKAALGVRIERTKPTAALIVRPSMHPTRVRLEFRGPTRVLELVIETTGRENGSEPRLVAGAPSTPPAAPSAPPASLTPEAVAVVAPPSASPPTRDDPPPADTTTAAAGTALTPPAPSLPPPSIPPAPALTDTAGSSELVWAKRVTIGRREGLPGQPVMILVDALGGRESIWFRFRLEGGAPERVARVSWEQGDVTTFDQDLDGKDRRIVVRLPKDRVTPRTRLELKLESGPSYRFALSAPTLSNLLKSAFQ